ncbi:hypothetical protein GH714_005763 [Hevea brasiliensis]|uniref:F-box/LRR-repeat protein 15-like leucin rich repeat domain-containing protein n=1 Tax=Hevea brasiliensis TaxID=3981 RepID=A0A6A6KIL2_HEVBR|nr:hypothetical protein GH714_005763 [Hevea brasiliensis]
MLVRACPFLERVDVSYCCSFGDREAAAISCAGGLRELTMDKCLGVSDVGLAKIAVGCGKLKRLSLKWCMEISDLGVGLLCKKCLDLKYLDVSYLKVTSESLRSIASLPKLEFWLWWPAPWWMMWDYNFLKMLVLHYRQLMCQGDCLSSSSFISIIRVHSGLRQINAAYCFSELSPALLHCMKDLKNLSTIIINGALVSDTIFTTMSSYFRNLVCLKLETCNMITEEGVEQLGSHCLLLEELDLTDCSGINDKGLEYLSRCSRLLCLKLGVCANISDKGLLYIALIVQSFMNWIYTGDDGLAALSSGCKKLKKLNLSYCSNITDRGMKLLGYLEELSDLELRGLGKITSVGLTAFAAKCRTIADLDLKHCWNIDDMGFSALAYYSLNLRQVLNPVN